jgi:outer membrane protein OmpA-like peptidoglycan-associated protein
MPERIQESTVEKRGSVIGWILAAVALLLLAGLGFLGFQIFERLESIETRVGALKEQAETATATSEAAFQEARHAEETARAAAEGRVLAEAETVRAKEETVTAVQDAASARQERDEAREEAERIRAEAEAELERLEEALGKIAETRRTALGLVMNLGEDSIKFDFDKADLKPENRELLSRVAGILLSSPDFTVGVNGHTDDVGTTEYNQKLSERRAQAVRDYLVGAGLSPEIMTVTGWGKSNPRVQGASDAARAKNRRVELAIVNARVQYKGMAPERP